MVADLRKMQENQWVSEIRIDKSRFVEIIITDEAHYVKQKRDSDCIKIRVLLVRVAGFPACGRAASRLWRAPGTPFTTARFESRMIHFTKKERPTRGAPFW